MLLLPSQQSMFRSLSAGGALERLIKTGLFASTHLHCAESRAINLVLFQILGLGAAQQHGCLTGVKEASHRDPRWEESIR